MTNDPTLTRRGLFMKLGILFNGLVATALAVPIGRFLLSSVTRGRANGYLDWVSLGPVSEFPEGETRLATFRNPLVMPTDGTRSAHATSFGFHGTPTFRVHCRAPLIASIP